MDVSKFIIVWYGFIVLLNFALVAEANFHQIVNLNNLNNITTSLSQISQMNTDEDGDSEFVDKTFPQVAIFSIEVLTTVSAFSNELWNETVKTKEEEISHLKQKLEQLEEEPSERKETDENKLEKIEFESTYGYNEHGFQQLFYNKKMNKVIYLVKKNIELQEFIQNVRNEMQVDELFTAFSEMGVTELPEENENIARNLISKFVKNRNPQNISYEDSARTVIKLINSALETPRLNFNEKLAKKNEEIRLLREQIDDTRRHRAVEGIENVVVSIKDEL